MDSWKTSYNRAVLGESVPEVEEVRNFGEAWGIAHGLRFGEPEIDSGFDNGEARKIWSPVTKHVMELWHEYRQFLEGHDLQPEQFSPDFIQIDDREWSLGFATTGDFELSRIQDFCEYLVSVGFKTRSLYFDVWSESVEGLDFRITTRVGVTAQSRYSDINLYEHSELASPPMRDLPLGHTVTGQIVHLKKRAFDICKVCNFSGIVWCNNDQIMALERLQAGNKRGFLDHFSAWDYVTFKFGLHQGCIKDTFSIDKIEDMYRASLLELT